MKETNIMKRVMMKATKLGARLMRNHVGMGYQGKVIKVFKPTHFMLNPGDVLLREAYTMTFGLGVGSSDTIGWTSIQVTQEMVGNVLAIFTAAEVKTDIGQPTDDQINFINVVRNAGGIAGVVRSEDDIETLITCGSIE